ncbi:MAG: TatD family hydrolase [Kiritimatiellae bacterium]|nr:TatD family hydrolase [Kiritimatiellia bacterium]
MKLFDTHFHFYDKNGEPEEYWNEIKIPELEYVLAVGADFEESKVARDFASKIDNSWFAAGVHPHGADEIKDGIACFDEFKNDDKLVAIGEIGLDYFYENSERETQKKIMELFLEQALKLNLPAIVHCRDQNDKDQAYLDAFEMLKDFSKDGGQFELHCFAGTPFWAENFLDLGAYLGVTGIVTFPAAKNIRDSVKVIPLDRLLVETDSPYLAPVPHRGKPNNPGYVIEVAKKVAEVKGITADECAKITTKNAFEFFRIEGLPEC